MSDPKLPEGKDPVWTMYGYAEQDAEPFDRVQENRRKEGRCVHCGEILEVKWTGLQDCKVCTNEASER